MKIIILIATAFFCTALAAPKNACDLLKQDAPKDGDLSSSVDLIVIGKADRKMILFRDEKPLKQYHVSLGFSPEGRKVKAGDGKTPEGRFAVKYKNANSAYHLALKISYPGKEDITRAERLGIDPGDDIMIHGFPNDDEAMIFAYQRHNTLANWTQGCIAVTDSEIEEIFPRVADGTAIQICP